MHQKAIERCCWKGRLVYAAARRVPTCSCCGVRNCCSPAIIWRVSPPPKSACSTFHTTGKGVGVNALHRTWQRSAACRSACHAEGQTRWQSTANPTAGPGQVVDSAVRGTCEHSGLTARHPSSVVKRVWQRLNHGWCMHVHPVVDVLLMDMVHSPCVLPASSAACRCLLGAPQKPAWPPAQRHHRQTAATAAVSASVVANSPLIYSDSCIEFGMLLAWQVLLHWTHHAGGC